MNNSRIISPCINSCNLDEAKDICKGCGRTSKEITHWIFYTDNQRIEIMRDLTKRLETYINVDSKKTSR